MEEGQKGFKRQNQASRGSIHGKPASFSRADWTPNHFKRTDTFVFLTGRNSISDTGAEGKNFKAPFREGAPVAGLSPTG